MPTLCCNTAYITSTADLALYKDDRKIMAKRKKKPDFAKLQVSQSIFRAGERESAKRMKHICPVYRPKTANEPELIGTGFFFAIGPHRFVITAAHVFGPSGEGNQQLLIPSHATGNLTELTGLYIRSKPCGGPGTSDQNDVGIVVLDNVLADQIDSESFVSLDLVDVDDTGDSSKPYFTMGFPWRVSPKVCLRSRTAEASPFNYTTELIKNERLLSLGLSPSTHFLLRYAKRHSRDKSGRDLTAPSPQGMSGGPVWRIESHDTQGETSRLVGVVIEWHEREGGLLAFRLPLVLAGIGQLFPDIAHLIPQTQTLSIEITSPPLAP